MVIRIEVKKAQPLLRLRPRLLTLGVAALRHNGRKVICHDFAHVVGE